MIKNILTTLKSTHDFKHVEFLNFKNSKNVSKLLQNFKASKVQVTMYKWVIMCMMYKKYI